MANAGNVVSSLGSGTSLLGGGGGPGGGPSISGRSNGGGITGSSVLGNYQTSGSSKTNTRIPGFVNIIAGWFAKQLDEVVTKLADLPDLYILYPDPNALPAESLQKPTSKIFQMFLLISINCLFLKLKHVQSLLRYPLYHRRKSRKCKQK